MISKNLWKDDMETKMRDEQKALIDAAVEKSEHFKPDPTSMFTNVYSNVTPNTAI